jgi:hypothetical protein
MANILKKELEEVLLGRSTNPEFIKQFGESIKNSITRQITEALQTGNDNRQDNKNRRSSRK